MQFTTSFLAFSFGALALILPSGYSWGPAALLLCAIGAAIRYRSAKFILPRPEDKVLVISFILFFLVALFEVLVHGTTTSELDKPSRFILALLVLALLNERPPSESWVWLGFATGAIGACLVALYHVFVVGLHRAGGGMNPIQFGNLSMLLGLISLCGIGYTLKNEKKAFLFKIFMSAAFFAGVLGSFLSGTRGGWLALAVIPPIVFVFYAQSVNTKKVLAGIFLICIASVVLMNVAGNSVERRINSAITEMEAYHDVNNTRSSLGVRLELWKTAWLLGKSKPLIGWGTNGLQEGKQHLVEQELVSKNALRFSHAHNDYLDLFIRCFALLSSRNLFFPSGSKQ